MPLSKAKNKKRMRIARAVQPVQPDTKKAVQPNKANLNSVQPKREMVVINGVPYWGDWWQ